MEKMMMIPKVSIICITYNHENYIRQAIDGFLMQKTNFDYEILIHDDASTDNTQEIIREYQNKYPDKFRTILQTENQYSQGIQCSMNLIKIAKGEYLAFCEGDDYWIDENKLQIQVDILERHLECSGCGHNISIVDHKSELFSDSRKENWFSHSEDVVLNIDEVSAAGRFAHTPSIMLRRRLFGDMLPEMMEDYGNITANGDAKMSLLMALEGDFYFIAQNMACYRYVVDFGHSWSTRVKNKNMYKFYYYAYKGLNKFTRDYYGVVVFSEERFLEYIVMAFKIALKSPSKENINIFLSIMKDDKRNWCILFTSIFMSVKRKIKRVIIRK